MVLIFDLKLLHLIGVGFDCGKLFFNVRSNPPIKLGDGGKFLTLVLELQLFGLECRFKVLEDLAF